MCVFSSASTEAQAEFIPVGTTPPPPCDAPDCEPVPDTEWETVHMAGVPNPGPVLEAGLKDVPTLDTGLKSVLPSVATP